MIHPTFIADVHLGKLARLLRLLGFDTGYNNAFAATQVLEIARSEHRILLSRNGAYAKQVSIHSLHIKSEDPEIQLQQVVQYFILVDQFRPFSRCLVCNGLLKSVPKKSISGNLQQNSAKYFDAFWQCESCGRIYWKGSHYERMLRLFEKMKLLRV